MTSVPHRKNVLIAEDDPVTKVILKAYIEKCGYQVTEVENGRDALDAFVAVFNGITAFKFVCLDINMPKMDGLTALIEMRKAENVLMDDTSEKVPIFMISNLASPKNAEKAFFQGDCSDFLQKPIDFSMLEESLRRHRLL